MSLINLLRKYVPPLTEEQVKDIAKEAEAIIREKVKAEEATARAEAEKAKRKS